MIALLLLLPLALGFGLFGIFGGEDDAATSEEGADAITADGSQSSGSGGGGSSGGDTQTEGDLLQDILSGEDNPLYGDSGNETIVGTEAPDVILGRGGDDDLRGRAGDDSINAGPGDDTVDAGDGNDSVDGLDGNDLIRGGRGLDQLLGGEGDDIIEGEEDNDQLEGGLGADSIGGGDGNDVFLGLEGNDVLIGNAGDDTLSGGDDSDILEGGIGQDSLSGGDGDDLLFGGNRDTSGFTTGRADWTAEMRAALDELAQANPALATSGNTSSIFASAPFDDVETSSGRSAAPVDTSADILDGGAGNDNLYLQSGDVGTGGAGIDTFYLFGDSAPASAMTIADYAASDDMIVVEYENGVAAPSVAVSSNGGDAVILLDGTVYAQVTGAAGNLAAGDVTLVAVDRT